MIFKLYQSIISPLLHTVCGPLYGCRFLPTCSEYSKEAIQIHGLLKGSKLTLFRISRCHPFSRAGYDPVPHVIASTRFKPHFDLGRQ